MEPVPADTLTGRMLEGRYHVRSRIAHGGMATVYLATDTRLDREVALKVMHADLARDDDFVDRFIGEAKSVARLSHPNVVGVYDQGSDGKYLYLAMEYVPGQTLRELLRARGWLPWHEALAVMDPLLAGLAAAHQAGIVHRDMKPENVLLTADGRVKVVDFGLARASAAASNTRSGLIIGSVAYIAPEQVVGGVCDARTDVYSTGVMLFEMLTGRQPFVGESPLSVAYMHVNLDVPPVGALVGGVPPAVARLVQAATSRDPQLRPPHAGAFLRAAQALRGIPAPSESAPAAWAIPAAAAAGAGTGSYGGAGSYTVPNPYLGADRSGPDNVTGAGTGSRTMVVDGDYASTFNAGPGTGSAGSGVFASPAGAFDGDEEREPFLQRWLFSRRLVYLGIAVAVLLGLGGGAWWLSSGRYTPIPAVARLTKAAAEKELEQAGFHVRAGSPVINDNVPKGTVISASPSGRAPGGTTITLTISSGPKMITVPQVPTTDTVAQATQLLRGAGLTVSSTTKPVGAASNPAIGTVAGTTPGSGTSWPENKPVQLEVVAGLTLPNLVNQNIQTIQTWLGTNHISVSATNVSSDKPQNIIVSQAQPAGSLVKPGQTVNVSVSSGPPMITIPNVVGEQLQQAEQDLRQAGFQVTEHRNFFGFGHQVTSTSPSGTAPEGSTITVNYGRF
jgi:eukaryotic-like serine/threonine-protein kinase